ncbi:MAG: hypothetical protein AB7G23_06150 [Vicinamibacterales bacterium]
MTRPYLILGAAAPRATRPVTALVLGLALGLVACSGGSVSTPTMPTPGTDVGLPTIASLTLVPATTVGGTAVQATVALTGPAPTGGSTVTVFASNSAAVIPSSVIIPAGAPAATFTVNTTAVTAQVPITITVSYLTSQRIATLTVTPPAAPVLTASFRVTSSSRGADACVIVGDDSQLDCTFDGSASTGGVRTWRWTYFIGVKQDSSTSSDPVTRPAGGCGFLGGQESTNQGGVQFVQMEVRLAVEDAQGNVSNQAVNRNVRMFPNGKCGYGF